MRMLSSLDALQYALEGVASSLSFVAVLAVGVLLWWLVQWREH